MELRPAHVMAVAWTMAAIASIAVCLRLYIRLRMGAKRLSASDYIIGASGLLGPTCGILSTLILTMRRDAASTDSEHDAAVMSRDSKYFYAKLVAAIITEYYVLIWLTKFAFVALFLELGEYMSRKMRTLLLGIAVYCFLAFWPALLTTMLNCGPVSASWDRIAADPKDANYCYYIDKKTLIIYYGLHSSSDLMLLLFPLFLLTSLNLSRHDKFGFAFVFVLASLALTLATVRFAILYTLIDRSRDPGIEFGLHTHLWSCLEETAGVLASCLPAYRILFRREKRSRESYEKHISSRAVTPEEMWGGADLRNWEDDRGALDREMRGAVV